MDAVAEFEAAAFADPLSPDQSVGSCGLIRDQDRLTAAAMENSRIH